MKLVTLRGQKTKLQRIIDAGVPIKFPVKDELLPKLCKEKPSKPLPEAASVRGLPAEFIPVCILCYSLNSCHFTLSHWCSRMPWLCGISYSCSGKNVLLPVNSSLIFGRIVAARLWESLL